MTAFGWRSGNELSDPVDYYPQRPFHCAEDLLNTAAAEEREGDEQCQRHGHHAEVAITAAGGSDHKKSI
jgi:hypothetical protein